MLEVKSQALTLIEKLMDKCIIETHNNIHAMFSFKNHGWFFKEIMKKGLIKYLEIATEKTLAESAKSLLYAFTYPGTRESIIKLSQGIFGSQSIVFIEDNENPAVVGIKIKNANERNFVALATDKNITLSTEDKKFILLTMDLERTIQHDTHQFFKDFLTPGRSLKAITIEGD